MPELTAPAGLVDLARWASDLGKQVVGSDPGLVDAAVEEGVRQLAAALRVDAALLWWTDGHASTTVRCLGSVPSRSPAPIAGAFSGPPVGGAWSFTRLDEIADPAARAGVAALGLASAVAVAVPMPDGPAARLAAGSRGPRAWSDAVVDGLHVAAALLGQALARVALLRAAPGRTAPSRIRAVEAPAIRGSIDLPAPGSRERDRAPGGDGPFAAIVGQSLAIRRALDQIQQVAATDSTVLLLGETGSGKELLATAVHELSARRGRPMVRVSCSAIPATLIESELFGRERGAFTGALARQIGRFELADRSTIFLDEIGELPAEVQVKLLRVLEERQFERLGSPKGIQVDVRIVAATHRHLEERIAAQAFREDLFYRLNVFPVRVPPLRDRAEDIPLLVWRFVGEFSSAFGKRIDTIPRDDMAALQRYPWPGNVRELRNVVERAMIVATGPQLRIAAPEASRPGGRHSVVMVDVEKEHIRSVLQSAGWRIRGAGGAAERLGLRPTTLETRMTRLGIARPERP